MLLAALAGWLDREQRDVIVFLREENRALKAQLGGRRLRLDECPAGVPTENSIRPFASVFGIPQRQVTRRIESSGSL